MARVLPQTGLAGPAAISRVPFEAIELAVRERLARNRNQPDSSSHFLENSQRCAQIEAGQEERQRQNNVEQRLKLKEEKKAQRELRFPFLAQLNVTTLLLAPNHPREKQIQAEPQAPESRHRRDRPLSRVISRSGPGVPQSQESQPHRPAKIHDRGILD